MNLNRKTAQTFYNSKAWKRCKEAYLSKANHLCEICLEQGKYTPADIVHHKIFLTDENFGDAALMFGFDNLQAVCIEHHNDIHGKTKTKRRWAFVDGKLITKELDASPKEAPL